MAIYRWLDTQNPLVRVGLKLILKACAIVLLILGFMLLIYTMAIFIALFATFTSSFDLSLMSSGIAGAIGAIIALVTASSIWSYSYLRRGMALTGASGDHDRLGEAFRVRFYRFYWSESPQGNGSLQFTPNGLLISATRFRYHLLVQLLIFMALFIVFFIFFERFAILITLVCLELIERLIKKPKQYLIPFDELKLHWKAKHYAIFKSARQPKQLDIEIAQQDWPRFERELERHALFVAGEAHLARA
jgi:hypothetical protein